MLHEPVEEELGVRPAQSVALPAALSAVVPGSTPAACHEAEVGQGQSPHESRPSAFDLHTLSLQGRRQLRGNKGTVRMSSSPSVLLSSELGFPEGPEPASCGAGTSAKKVWGQADPSVPGQGGHGRPREKEHRLELPGLVSGSL